MLQKCLQGSQHSDNVENTACIMNDSAVTEESTESGTNELCNSKPVEEEVGCAENGDLLLAMLQQVRDDVKDAKMLIESHVTESKSQIEQLKNEIFSLKKQSNMLNARTMNEIQNVVESTSSINVDVTQFADNIQRRLQAVFESLKTLHSKSHSNTHRRKKREK